MLLTKPYIWNDPDNPSSIPLSALSHHESPSPASSCQHFIPLTVHNPPPVHNSPPVPLYSKPPSSLLKHDLPVTPHFNSSSPPLPKNEFAQVNPEDYKVNTKNNEGLCTLCNMTFLTITLVSLGLVGGYCTVLILEDDSKLGNNLSSNNASSVRSLYKEQSSEAKLLANVIRYFAGGLYAANIFFLWVDKVKMTRLRKDFHEHYFRKRGDEKMSNGKYKVKEESVEAVRSVLNTTRARKLKSYLWESVVVRISWAMIVLAILISDRLTDYYFDTMADNQANCALGIITFIFIGLFCLAIFVFKPQICPELKAIRKEKKLNWICLW